MEEKGELLYELSPKFDFFYELTMPTGKKMKSSFIAVIVTLIINVIIEIARSMAQDAGNYNYMSMFKIVTVIGLIFLAFVVLLFVARIFMQVLEYKGIKYKFYNNCMVYENSFLNQTKKTIEYSNIREIEIRRTMLDRILNYGVIIIYTNAEKAYGSATVIYAVKDIEKHYNNIESIVHNGNIMTNPIKTGDVSKDFETHDQFIDAINNSEVETKVTDEITSEKIDNENEENEEIK
jgi:Bacterial membrane flanked domain.